MLADFSALAPDRWLSVTPVNPTRRQVRVFGNMPEQSAGYTEAFAARTEHIAQGGQVAITLPTGIRKTNIVEWPTMWAGTVDLPTAPSAGARYRLVVAEYEEHLTDGANPYRNPLAAKARRLVFVEHVELT